jgi:transcriptional regulator with XRE-family HTH domain
LVITGASGHRNDRTFQSGSRSRYDEGTLRDEATVRAIRVRRMGKVSGGSGRASVARAVRAPPILGAASPKKGGKFLFSIRRVSLRRENMVARLLRALSGKSQAQAGRETEIHPSLLASFETGKAVPRPEDLEKLARLADLTVEEASGLLDLAEIYRQGGARQAVEDAEDALHRLCETLTDYSLTAYEQIRALPAPATPPAPADREEAEEVWRRLAKISPEGREAAVRLVTELQTWALCERICHESGREAAEGRGKRALELARLAREVADRVGGPEEWRNRLRGYAAAHLANAFRLSGDPEAANAALQEAKSWWNGGADPGGLLDEGWVM